MLHIVTLYVHVAYVDVYALVFLASGGLRRNVIGTDDVVQ